MEITLAVLSIISLSFMIAYIAVVKKLKTVSDGFAQLLVAYTSTSSALENTQSFASSSEDQDIHKENFIKFLSDSRDWAFDYIEQSQETIQEVIKELNESNRKDLSDKLIKLLPENLDDRR
jgi:hypothetical protein